MKHILMVKKCMTTGLNYLCKTNSQAIRNPYEYKGSGKHWLRHINKHKSYVVTCIVGEYNTKEELKQQGTLLSEQFNVVESEEWANLVPEQGDGGWIHDQTGNTWKVNDSSRMGKHKNQWMNDDGSRATKQSERMKNNNPSFGKPKTEKQIEASRQSSRVATEASKKKVMVVNVDNNTEQLFESKRAVTQQLKISYDVLNYRLKTGKMYRNYKFLEV